MSAFTERPTTLSFPAPPARAPCLGTGEGASCTPVGMLRLGWIPPGSGKQVQVSAAAGPSFPPNLPHSGCKRRGHVSPGAAEAPWCRRKESITKWGCIRPIPGVQGPWSGAVYRGGKYTKVHTGRGSSLKVHSGGRGRKQAKLVLQRGAQARLWNSMVGL